MIKKTSDELKYLPYIILQNFDYEIQINTIQKLLSKHQEVESETERDIQDISNFLKEYTGDKQGFYYEFLQDNKGEKIQSAIYQNAAHSMAAVGMLAPFVESFFFQAFTGIKKVFYTDFLEVNDHARWKASDSKIWDCHYVLKNGKFSKDISLGIKQLSEAICLDKYLPADIQQVFAILFSYRNKMFHHGLEWPLRERQNYLERIKKENWIQDWISFATINNDPWIFYLTDNYIEYFFANMSKVIMGIAEFVETKLDEIKIY